MTDMAEDIDRFLEKEEEMLEMEEERLEEIVDRQLEDGLHSPEVPDKVEKPEDIQMDPDLHEEFETL